MTGAQRVLLLVATWGAGLLAAGPASAQWPGRIEGRVVDAQTGRPVAFASIEVAATESTTTSGSDGRFRIAAVADGRHHVRVTRFGYREVSAFVEVTHGRSERLTIRLSPAPIDVEPVVLQLGAPDRRRIERQQIVASGARTVGEVVDRIPGVVVRRRGSGGGETASIRGSTGDAVLVLLDGVPLNDPVTGEADLSHVPPSRVESITVHLGARSAEYGPRARAGAIVIESRAPGSGSEVRIGAGSLGATHVAAETGSAVEHGGWHLLAEHRSLSGEFSYRLPQSVGAIEGRRLNADRRRTHVAGALDRRLGTGRLGIRVGLQMGDRGLPGKAFAPARHARQQMARGRITGSWSRERGVAGETIAAYAGAQSIRHRDPQPPIGVAYDDRNRLGDLGLRLAASRRVDLGPVSEFIARGEVRRRTVDGDALEAGSRRSFTDLGFGAGAKLLSASSRGRGVELVGRVGVDRDDVTSSWVTTYALDASSSLGPVRLEAAHRTAYAPPALGDLFFDAAIGVAPNPDLRSERTRGELELGVSVANVAGLGVDAGTTVYRADVRDMIEWAPDFRFIWSPRNFDVRRRGGEAWVVFENPRRGVRVDVSYAHARVTYASHEDRGQAQILYRPRNTARVAFEWRGTVWKLGAESSYTGRRNTAPTELNALPGFWTLDFSVSRRWSLGALEADTALWIERAAGQTDALIFGFPEAGRQVRFELRLRPTLSDNFPSNSPEKGEEDDDA